MTAPRPDLVSLGRFMMAMGRLPPELIDAALAREEAQMALERAEEELEQVSAQLVAKPPEGQQ